MWFIKSGDSMAKKKATKKTSRSSTGSRSKKKVSSSSSRTKKSTSKKKASTRKKSSTSRSKKNAAKKTIGKKKSTSKEAAAKTKSTRARKRRSATASNKGPSKAVDDKTLADSAIADQRKGIVLNLPGVAGMAVPTFERPFVVEYFPSPEQYFAELKARRFELESQRNAAERTLARIHSEWCEQLAVCKQRAAITVSFRTKYGHVVAPLQYVILVDLCEKLPATVVQSHGLFRFPPSVDGIPVKVRQIQVHNMAGRAKGMSGTLTVDATANTTGDVQGGEAIESSGPGVKGAWGTLGLCVPDQIRGLVGLTNHHVGGDVNNQVATLSGNLVGNVTHAGKHPSNDAAAIDDANDSLAAGLARLNIAPSDIRFLKNDNLEKIPWLKDDPVFKIGAAMPNPVFGKLIHLNRSVDVPDLADSKFFNVMEVESLDSAFIQPGDSGSVLLQKYNDGSGERALVIGLNFAGTENGEFAYAFPFHKIMKDLSLEIDDNLLVAV